MKKLQSLPLDEKIQISKARIIEFANRYNNQVYVSFSGGKDSTVLLDLVRNTLDSGNTPPLIPAVFVDTGLEFPEIRDFVKTKENVVWLKPEMNFRKVIETYGYPLISKEVAKRLVEYNNAKAKNKLEQSLAYQEFNGIRKSPCGKSLYNKQKWRFLIDSPYKIDYRCCDIMKKKPSKQFEKETHRKPLLGTMTIESRARKTAWLKHGCNAFESDRPTSCPLSFWTEQDILKYLQLYKTPYCSVYGEIKQDESGNYFTTGEKRTGCVFCGYGAHLEKEPNRFQRLKVTHPKLWNYCMKPWDEGGLGMREALEYINVKVD